MKKYDWEIHYLSNGAVCECCGKEVRDIFRDYMCDAHTCGLDKYGSLELQIVLNVEPQLIGYILNSIGERVRDGELVLEDGMLIGSLFEGDVKLKVFETTDSQGEPVFRLIIPDSKLKFPEESDEEPYCLQYRSPYLSKFN